MATSNLETDQAWGMLADVEEEERRTQMLQRYAELAALPEEERVSRMLMMAAAEYGLPDDKLRTFTVSRLSVWLMLDPGIARTISASYNAAMVRMPGPQAMRQVALIQTLAREFPKEQQQQLVALIPDVFGGLKEVLLATPPQPATPAAPPTPAKKGWWPFGKR